MIPLATQLIARKYVKIGEGTKLGSITRGDVTKVKPF